jgi:hypothetical protein
MSDDIQYMEITVRPECFGTKKLGGQASGAEFEGHQCQYLRGGHGQASGPPSLGRNLDNSFGENRQRHKHPC